MIDPAGSRHLPNANKKKGSQKKSRHIRTLSCIAVVLYV